jgi:hypothetical protein
MILLTLAAIAIAQWTGPRTEEYLGPGNFCGGGYRVVLAQGERALVLPQGRGAPAARVILSGHNVSIWTNAIRQPGPIVIRYGDVSVTQSGDGGRIVYTISDQTDFSLRVTSDSFKGFNRDRWFFAKANFASGADERVPCLASYSY